MVGRVGELDREARLQARAQGGGPGIQRREGLVEGLDALLVDAQDRHRPGRPRRARSARAARRRRAPARRPPQPRTRPGRRRGARRRRAPRRAGSAARRRGRCRRRRWPALSALLEQLRRGGRRRCEAAPPRRGPPGRRPHGRERGRAGERVPRGGDQRRLVAGVRTPGQRLGRAGVEASPVAGAEPLEQRVLHQRVSERGGGEVRGGRRRARRRRLGSRLAAGWRLRSSRPARRSSSAGDGLASAAAGGDHSATPRGARLWLGEAASSSASMKTVAAGAATTASVSGSKSGCSRSISD